MKSPEDIDGNIRQEVTLIASIFGAITQLSLTKTDGLLTKIASHKATAMAGREFLLRW